MTSKIMFGVLPRDPDTEAEQYGVKGMKWGVRKDSDKGSDSDLGEGGGGGAGDDELTPGQNFVDTKKPEAKHSDLRTGEYLEQYGVRGMKWGFRKSTTRGGTPPSNRKAGKKSVEKEDPKPKKKTVKDLSDTELNDRIRRLQAEKTYAQLTTPQKSRNIVADVLATSGKQIAGQVITQVGTAYISKAIGVNLNKALPPAYQVVSGKKG